MDNYIRQLLADITHATENVSWPFAEQEGLQIQDWISDEEEDQTAPVRNLEDWTGIHKDQLPPPEMLSEGQVHLMLTALKKMLEEYNWSFILQIKVPERIQYAAIRDNFNQEAKVKRWHPGFFELCREGTEHKKCALGEYCHCAFFEELCSGFVDEELTPEEERERQLRFEINYLKKKYDDDWKKYYPYHLDANFDDENGNPYGYSFGDEEDNEEEGDDWWRK